MYPALPDSCLKLVDGRRKVKAVFVVKRALPSKFSTTGKIEHASVERTETRAGAARSSKGLCGMLTVRPRTTGWPGSMHSQELCGRLPAVDNLTPQLVGTTPNIRTPEEAVCLPGLAQFCSLIHH